jgi:hypothetical protein
MTNTGAITYQIPDAIQGDTFDGIEYDVTVNGTTIDLTSATIKMDLRTSPTGALVLSLDSDGNGLTILTPPTDGKFTIDQQIVDVPARTYSYDIEIDFHDGRVKTYISGTWPITQDVTHA